MKKIGIISELSMNNVNYGNRLQAYALNRFINDNYDTYDAYSIILNPKQKNKITKFSVAFIAMSFFNKLKKHKKVKLYANDLVIRKELFNNFTNTNIKFILKNVKWRDLEHSDFDLFIVGSDVVWSQSNHVISRVKFLNFHLSKKVVKMSYAASFGRDYIPKQNIKYIKRYLSDFIKVSVREKSSVVMLEKIGINNVCHVCDPTLLLSENEWMSLEKDPGIVHNKYIFVYLLGKNSKQRQFIVDFAKKCKLKIINIPCANGKFDNVDENFGDFSFSDCSPENWLWLIHHAEYIFTDSFHGLVFSVLYRKKFVAVKRVSSVDINNRIIDFLNTINQEDKFVDLNSFVDFEKAKWDYDMIEKLLSEFIKYSKSFLDDILRKE